MRTLITIAIVVLLVIGAIALGVKFFNTSVDETERDRLSVEPALLARFERVREGVAEVEEPALTTLPLICRDDLCLHLHERGQQRLGGDWRRHKLRGLKARRDELAPERLPC